MNRIVLFSIVAVVILLIDWYAYFGLKVAISGFSPSFQKAMKWLFWGLTIITLLTFLLFQPMSEHEKTRSVLMIMMTIGFANILGKLLFSIWIILSDALRFLQWGWAKINPRIENLSTDNSISRNQFITQVGAASAALPMITLGWGILSGAHDYRVLRRTIPVKGLPKSFDGFAVTQISDLHVGSFWNKSAVIKGVELANQQKSDVIFFTGDLVNNVASELTGWTEVFSKLRADFGVFSILGNHDYGDYVSWNSIEDKRKNLLDLIQSQREMGWDLMLNEHRKIRVGNDDIAVIGVENWSAKGRFPKYGRLDDAYQDIGDSGAKLLLSHDPSHWRGQVLGNYKDIDITFSGHTHGMQFGIEVGSVKWSPVKYLYPEWADLYSSEHQHLYVNRGFGYIGYPGRFGILPEITVIKLVTA